MYKNVYIKVTANDVVQIQKKLLQNLEKILVKKRKERLKTNFSCKS